MNALFYFTEFNHPIPVLLHLSSIGKFSIFVIEEASSDVTSVS